MAIPPPRARTRPPATPARPAPAGRLRLVVTRLSLRPRERLALAAMAGVVVVLFVLGFGLLLLAAGHRTHVGGKAAIGIGTGVLALTLGMRHAFDADHISAIDNTTRKLMAEGKRPLGVGFYFSLGHSSIVFVMAILLSIGVKTFDQQLRSGGSTLHHVTTVLGTSVSGAFLYLIAAMNAVVLWSVIQVFLDMRRGRYDEAELERQLGHRGLMNRFFGRLTRRIDRSWKMYPVGALFGLGFDTVTEVALLVLSGTAVASGLPVWAVLSLPLLFAAGMSLFDTLDGCFMNFAYGWAFSRPVRKVYYNLVVTGLSVAVAFVVGTVELLALLGTELRLHGSAWALLAGIDLNRAGFFIVGLFVVTWVVALAVWRFGHIEERWATPATVTAPTGDRSGSALDHRQGETVVALDTHRLDLGPHHAALGREALVEAAGAED
ncbi:MAG: HoxN/HupN/NixA family nickel/cobalt transporter [Acidimicrobiales bacterium]